MIFVDIIVSLNQEEVRGPCQGSGLCDVLSYKTGSRVTLKARGHEWRKQS